MQTYIDTYILHAFDYFWHTFFFGNLMSRANKMIQSRFQPTWSFFGGGRGSEEHSAGANTQSTPYMSPMTILTSGLWFVSNDPLVRIDEVNISWQKCAWTSRVLNGNIFATCTGAKKVTFILSIPQQVHFWAKKKKSKKDLKPCKIWKTYPKQTWRSNITL